jgi:hypothetical protein
MSSSRPMPAPCQWYSWLAAALDRRSDPRHALLFLGAVLARSRRTVMTWIKAAKLSDRFRSCYTAVAAAGKKAVLTVDDLDVGQRLAPPAHEVPPAAEQVAGGPHLGGVDVVLVQQSGAEEEGDLLGVDLVVLGLGAVDGPHVQGMAQDEGDALLLAGVGQPVPGEHALAGDDQAVAVGGNRFEEGRLGGGDVLVEEGASVMVEDAEEHGPGVEVGSAVGSWLTLIKSPHGPHSDGTTGSSRLQSDTRKSRRPGRGLDEYPRAATDPAPPRRFSCYQRFLGGAGPLSFGIRLLDEET